MKFLKTYKIFEKTSLINLNVPFVVMKQIQRDYTFSDDAKWEQIKYKKDFISTIKKDKNSLIISVGRNKIFIVFSYDNDYYIETYNQILNDDFGNVKWQRIDRFKASLEEIIKMIYTRGCKSYELISGNWSYEFSNIRKIRKENIDFDITTQEFKKDFIKNYSKISKKIYGESGISNDIIKANSLTNFEEDLINFEDEYSDKYKEYLNIPIMIEKWSRDKIMTALLIYLRTKKLIKL
jgi:hypothetical protein